MEKRLAEFLRNFLTANSESILDSAEDSLTEEEWTALDELLYSAGNFEIKIIPSEAFKEATKEIGKKSVWI